MVKVYSEALGLEIEVPDEPKRIVSLSPAITETLYRLGLADRIVAVSYFCHKPPEAREKPKVGSYLKVEYEKMEALEPDLVLTTTGAQRKVLEDLVKRGMEKGYAVYPIPLPVTAYGILDEITIIGMLTGRVKEARSLAARLASEYTSLKDSLAGVKVYYEIFLGGPVSAAAHSYVQDILEFLGAVTPFAGERKTWVIEPDPGVIREFDPDVILYEKSPYAPLDEEKIRADFEKRGLGDLTALREGRLVILEPDTLAHYGPSIFEDLKDIVGRVRSLIGR
ncbi:MAG: ABC transporter substrate-binding protein [Desulfurococcales archaeon]|nr:ABC transporter substrate-binding protein [Desulfurococcales archaeon]